MASLRCKVISTAWESPKFRGSRAAKKLRRKVLVTRLTAPLGTA
jgi:hypothetical protein